MVEKGLKVGATFEDGERKYKIIEVLDDGNYISKAVDKSDEKPAKIEKEN